MKKTEKNFIRKMVFNNYFNNIKTYDSSEKIETKSTIVSMVGDKDGVIIYNTYKLSFSDTVIDIFFREEGKKVAIYVCSKNIEYYTSLEGFINKRITFTKENVFNRN